MWSVYDARTPDPSMENHGRLSGQQTHFQNIFRLERIFRTNMANAV
jgi:hypothetical protein